MKDFKTFLEEITKPFPDGLKTLSLEVNDEDPLIVVLKSIIDEVSRQGAEIEKLQKFAVMQVEFNKEVFEILKQIRRSL